MKHGTRIKKKCVYCQKIFYVIPCKNHIKYCSHKCFIKSGSFIHKNKHSEESKNKNKKSHLGKENPKMVGHKFWGGENAKKNWFKKGQKPKNWKGGSASERNRIHNTSWYKIGEILFSKNSNIDAKNVEMVANCIFIILNLGQIIRN